MRTLWEFTRATLSLLALTVLAPVASGAAAAQGKGDKVDVARSIAADASIRLTVMVATATIRIVGWERDSFAIAGTLSRGVRLDGVWGPQYANARGAKLYIGAEKEGEGQPSSAAVELRVPARARLWVKAASADIEVSAFRGGLDLNVVGGKLRVAGAPRELTVEAMDGDVEVTASVPWLRVKTAGGAISVRGSSEDAVLASISGGITAAEGQFTRGRFESVTGDIRFTATVARSGALAFDSHSGKIELVLPHTTAADFDVATISGGIKNLLTKAQPIRSADGRGWEQGFTLGGGGAHVTIRTFKGPVVLALQTVK